MNKHLHELKQRAGIDYNPDQEGLDLFAELIVKECAEIARLNTRIDSKVYLMIQEHFGVVQ